MKFNKIFIFSLLSFSIAQADEGTYHCLKNLKGFEQKYITENPTVLLECSEDRKSCPFSTGSYHHDSKAIAIPFYNKGERGIVLHTEKGSSFVKLPTKNIKNEETRYVGFKSGKQNYCGEFQRDLGLATSPSIKSAISGVADYFNSALIGYDFKFTSEEKCKGLSSAPANDFFTEDSEKMLKGAIKRTLSESPYYVISNINTHWAQRKVISNEKCNKINCTVGTKDYFLEYTGILNSCAKGVKDASLAVVINKQLSELNHKAAAVGMIPKEISNQANGATSATAK